MVEQKRNLKCRIAFGFHQECCHVDRAAGRNSSGRLPTKPEKRKALIWQYSGPDEDGKTAPLTDYQIRLLQGCGCFI